MTHLFLEYRKWWHNYSRPFDIYCISFWYLIEIECLHCISVVCFRCSVSLGTLLFWWPWYLFVFSFPDNDNLEGGRTKNFCHVKSRYTIPMFTYPTFILDSSDKNSKFQSLQLSNFKFLELLIDDILQNLLERRSTLRIWGKVFSALRLKVAFKNLILHWIKVTVLLLLSLFLESHNLWKQKL